MIFTGRNCGQGNIFAPVCHSVLRGVSQHALRQTPPPPEQTPLPRFADSGMRSTNGRYASYWSAFLFRAYS